MGPMDAFCARHPLVDATIYVDDINLAVHGLPPKISLKLMTAASKDLIGLVRNELLGTIAPGKEAVISSHPELAEELRKNLALWCRNC